MQRSHILLTSGGLLFAAALSGCGGGADATTTVKYLPSRPDEAASAGAAPGEATASAAETAVAGGFGGIKGRVLIQGEVPVLPPLYEKGAAPKDPAVCGIEAAPNESIVANNGGLANVFIYLARPPRGMGELAKPEPIEFDQRACVFRPHAMVMRTGQLVKVLNDDAVAHNTHTYPKRNSPFNQTVAPNDRVGISLTYGRPETQPLQVGCDIHPWMIAYHLPIDHPYAVVSGPDGSFEIPNLPAGQHEFKVWHEKAGELERAFTVTVKANETVEVDIPVAAARLAGFLGPPSKVIQLSSTR
jgi:plastocyanin